VKLYVSGASTTMRRLAPHPHLGHLLTPHNGNRIESLLATGLEIAIDNAAFSNWSAEAFVALLTRLRSHALAHRYRFAWCAAPDVVSDARATLQRFWKWAGVIGWAGLPIAFVAQDGCEPLCGVPWGDIRCLFIGGSTKWKLGSDAARLIREAKRRGKLVHVGRVNSMQRIAHFDALGADSIDGTQFSMFPDRYIPRYLERLEWRQQGLLEVT
jgi:hypothetical protein